MVTLDGPTLQSCLLHEQNQICEAAHVPGAYCVCHVMYNTSNKLIHANGVSYFSATQGGSKLIEQAITLQQLAPLDTQNNKQIEANIENLTLADVLLL